MGQGRQTLGEQAAPLGVLCGAGGRKGKPCRAQHRWERRGQLWEGVSASWVGASGPRKQATGAPACRLPMPAPRGTMGCLLGPGQELRVGVGEGRPSEEEGRLARSGPAGQSRGQASWPAPLGLSLHSQPAPPEERQRTGAADRGGLGAWDLVSVPSASPSPCVSICSPAGTRGSSDREAEREERGGPGQQQGHPPTAEQGQGSGVWGHFQAAGTSPPELRGVSAVLFGLFGAN